MRQSHYTSNRCEFCNEWVLGRVNDLVVFLASRINFAHSFLKKACFNKNGNKLSQTILLETHVVGQLLGQITCRPVKMVPSSRCATTRGYYQQTLKTGPCIIERGSNKAVYKPKSWFHSGMECCSSIEGE